MEFPLAKRPLIFGILNVTPDSFSDGGEYNSAESAVRRSIQLLSDGADFVDIGAESTRPGSSPVSDAEEWERLQPVLSSLQSQHLISKVSVDTRHVSTMRRSAKLGCAWINCVGPLPEATDLKALKADNPRLGYVATHLHGTPQTMQSSPLSEKNVIRRVSEFFESSKNELLDGGFLDEETLFDPGIGFGKTDLANIAVIANCSGWSRTYPIAVGVSRKSIFSRRFGVTSVKDRDPVSKLAEFGLALAGVRMIRTHDVRSLSSCLHDIFRGSHL
jgi:dihydropteroate synthase